MNTYHVVEEIKFHGDFLEAIIDGTKRRFDLKTISPLLEKASDRERSTYEISPSGYGIHWPLLDEDISIDGLLVIDHAPVRKRKIA